MSAKDSTESRAALRRRLLLFSAPVIVIVIIAVVKLWSVVIAGGAAGADFANGDGGALRDDVSVLSVLNVVEPANADFAAGNLAVLEDRLERAEAQFGLALANTEPARSCPTRINLELVRETLGDRAVGASDERLAIKWYRDALDAIAGAPSECFSGSADPDENRRAVLDGAVARLNEKIRAASATPPPPNNPPPPDSGSAGSTPTGQDGQQTPTSTPPPPPQPEAADSTPRGQDGQQTPTNAPPPPPEANAADPTGTEPDVRLRLNPGSGDPLERLQQILRDSAATQGGG